MADEPVDPLLHPEADAQQLTPDDWKRVLAPIEFAILREHGTERPGTGRYLNEERAGAYHCAGCGQRLYDGTAKFHSGCGWPSFYQEAEKGALTLKRDRSHGMERTEMLCSRCGGHLGHVFTDAPDQPTGLRHCVNGFALVFVPEGEDPAEVLAAHRGQA